MSLVHCISQKLSEIGVWVVKEYRACNNLSSAILHFQTRYFHRSDLIGPCAGDFIMIYGNTFGPPQGISNLLESPCFDAAAALLLVVAAEEGGTMHRKIDA